MELTNCKIYIGRYYENGAIDQSTNHYYAQTNNDTQQPGGLDNEEAVQLLDKLRLAGYLDEQFQKLPSVSWAVASIIAHEVAELLQLPNIWQPFETLWQHKGLRSNYDGALNNNKQFVDIALKIKKILTT